MPKGMIGVLAVWVGLLGGAADPGATASLQPGAPISRTIAGSETHHYELAARKDEAFRFAVEQHGVEVAVSVTAPDGATLVESKSGNAFGSDSFMVVTAAAGVHGVHVKPMDEGAEPGAYEIALLERRPAAEPDRQRVAMESLATKALELADEGSGAALRAAIVELTRAIDGMRALGDRSHEAHWVLVCGAMHYDLTENDAAERLYREGLELARATGDKRNEALALNNLGLLQAYKGDAAGSIELLRAAHELGAALGDRRLQAATAANIALGLGRMGEAQQAFDHLQRALDLNQKPTDARLKSSLLNGLASTYLRFRHEQKARDTAEQALQIARASHNRDAEVAALFNLGQALWYAGETARGLELFNQCLEAARGIGHRRYQALALRGIGYAHLKAGRFAAAAEDLRAVLVLFEALGDRFSTASALDSLGDVYLSLGELEQAKTSLERALALFREGTSPAGEASAHVGLARLAERRGDLELAETEVREGLRLLELQRTKLTDLDARALYFAPARTAYEIGTRILVRRHHEHPDRGYDRAALEISERGRARAFLDELAAAQVDVHGEVDPALLARQHAVERDLRAAARRRERLSATAPAQEQKALDDEIERLLLAQEDAWTEIRRRHPGHAALLRPEPLRFEQVRSLLDADSVLLEFLLGDEHSTLWALTADGLSMVSLPPRAEIEADVRRLCQLTLARNTVVRFETPDERARRVAAADAELAGLAQRVSTTLLGPVADTLRGRRLVIVPDGALFYLPFAALPEPGTPRESRPLISEHEIVTLPSSSVLAALRAQGERRAPATRNVMVLADPVFGPDDPRLHRARSEPVQAAAPAVELRQFENAQLRAALSSGDDAAPARLPGTRREAQSILSLAGPGHATAALDFDASRARALSPALADFRVVHFATHGLLDTRSPRLSGLVLSLVDADGRPQDGFLRLGDLYNLRLNADLVVLSACETALGSEIKGEGLVGLTRGFMHAGAQRVLATLWRVDDAATAALMRVFYQGLLKENLRAADALRRAQRSVAAEARWKSPYYWSGFILQGEPR